MQITRELANEIRTKSKAILDREIVVAGASGLVVAGNQLEGDFSVDALKAAQDGKQINGSLGPNKVSWCPFVYEGRTIGVFGVLTDEGQIAAETFSLLTGLAEVIVHQHYLLDRMRSAETVKSNFIRELLTSPQFDPEAVHNQADILKLNLRSPQAVILARIEGFESGLHAGIAHLSSEEQRLELSRATERVTKSLRSGFMNYQDNIASYMGEDTFALLKGIGGASPNTVNTIRFLTDKGSYVHEMLQDISAKQPVTVGIGQYYPDLGGLRKSFQDATLALNVGSKVWGTGRVYHIKQVGMFTSLANIAADRKAELAHQILHPLLRDQQLYKTVRTFLQCGLNLTEASAKLHIHRNTLIYRLDKTKKLIALDPRHFDDALQIKLGLMFYQPA